MQGIIHTVRQKIKPHTTVILMVVFIASICVISFAFGYFYRMAVDSARFENESVAIAYPPYVTDLMQKGFSPTVNPFKTGENRAESGEESTALKQQLEATSGSYIASKSGSVYYPEGCKAMSRIAAENRVYFSSEAEAQTLGYMLSKSCD